MILRHKFPSVRRAAKFFWNRYKGRRKTRVESHEEQQHHDRDQEKVLGRHVLRLDDCGFPLKVKMVASIAASLIATK